MDSGCRLIFDPTPSRHHRGGHMLLLGRGANPIFQGARSLLDMEAAASNKRRLPFLITSPDDLLEEEYYDEQLPEKKRRLTPEQVQMLEVSFETENKLEPERKTELAKNLGLQPRQVAVWFQNRRARCKTKQLEQDFDRLKSSYDALVTDNDALRMDNDRLRSQVISLAEKLENTAPSGDTMGLIYKRDQAEQRLQERVEDRLSAVVEGEGRQVVDSSGESYFHENYQGGCGIGIQSEDDGSDEGCSYLPAEMLEVGQNNDVGLWMWN